MRIYAASTEDGDAAAFYEAKVINTKTSKARLGWVARTDYALTPTWYALYLGTQLGICCIAVLGAPLDAASWRCYVVLRIIPPTGYRQCTAAKPPRSCHSCRVVQPAAVLKQTAGRHRRGRLRRRRRFFAVLCVSQSSAYRHYPFGGN